MTRETGYMDPLDQDMQDKQRPETRDRAPQSVASNGDALNVSALAGGVAATAWRAIVEAMPDGVVVFGRNGRAVHMNAAARELLALVGAPQQVTSPLGQEVARGRVVDPQGQPVPYEAWPLYRLLAGDVLTGERAADVRYQRADGRTVMLSVSGAPLRDASGAITGAVTSLRDVTAQRHLETRTREALEALLAMAEVLVQTTAEPTASTPTQPVQDPAAQQLAQLTQRLLGCERLWIVTVDVAAGRQHPVAVAGLPEEQVQAWWAEAEQASFADHPRFPVIARLESGEPIAIDLRQPPFTEPPFSDAPNPWGLRSALIAPLRVRGRLMGVLAYDYGPVDHDFTPDELAFAEGVARLAALVLERERLQHERAAAQADALALREANRRMDEFISIVAHELRTPLTTIVAYLQLGSRLLEQTPADHPEVLRENDLEHLVARLSPAIGRSERQAQRLTRLVSDLLDVSRIQAGRLALRTEVVALAPLVREVVEGQRQTHPDREISLALPASVEQIMVAVDADRIGQVLTNYLTNALKYSPSDQPVDVTVRRERARVLVAVRDQGPGIPDTQQQQVWERFYRVGEQSEAGGFSGGLGLGLYISRTIVERHGGQVGLRSAPGKGSTFSFWLPIAGQSETAGNTKNA